MFMKANPQFGMVSETMANHEKIDNSVVASYLKDSLIQEMPIISHGKYENCIFDAK